MQKHELEQRTLSAQSPTAAPVLQGGMRPVQPVLGALSQAACPSRCRLEPFSHPTRAPGGETDPPPLPAPPGNEEFNELVTPAGLYYRQTQRGYFPLRFEAPHCLKALAAVLICSCPDTVLPRLPEPALVASPSWVSRICALPLPLLRGTLTQCLCHRSPCDPPEHRRGREAPGGYAG